MNEYSERVSLLRVWLVFLVLPLPALATTALLEFIPLQDPAEGWKANHGYWVRFFIATSIVGVGFLVQIKEMVPALGLTLWRIALIALPSSACTIGLYTGIASSWAFPVPFGLVLMCAPYVVFLVIFFLMIMGRERFRANPALGRQLQEQLGILVVQTSLCVIYPGLGAVYNALPVNQRSFFTIVFPIAKVLLSNAVAFAARDLTESLPGVALMSVEVFNALYLVKCMQNAGSSMTFVAILAFDLFESVMAFRDIRAQTEQLSSLIFKTAPQSLPQRVMELCLEPGVLHSRPCSLIRVRSRLKLNGSLQLNAILTSLETIGQTPIGPSVEIITNSVTTADSSVGFLPSTDKSTSQKETSSTRDLSAPAKIWALRHKVLPIPEPQVLDDVKSKQCHNTFAEKEIMVEQALRVFFQGEFHMLTEYVECAIPLVYSLHLAIMFHFPSRKYFTDMVDLTSEQLETTTLSIAVYAGLEVLSFIALHSVIKRELAFSPARALAFALENQLIEFQVKLMVWYLFVHVLTLDHCGRYAILIHASRCHSLTNAN